MTSEYSFDKQPTPTRADSAAVMINLWRAPDAERQRRFSRDMIDAVFGDELTDGELSFALFLSADGRDLMSYKQWTSKAAYDAFLSVRGLGGAKAFQAANPDVEFWHDWFAVDRSADTPALLHLGLRGDIALSITPDVSQWTVQPFDGVPLPGPTRFTLLRGIERPNDDRHAVPGRSTG